MLEIDLVETFVVPVGLDDGPLLAVDSADMHSLMSADGGRTWENKGPLRDARGRPLVNGERTRRVHLLKLNSGEIALKFEVREGEWYRGNSNKRVNSLFAPYFARSRDGGATWADPVRVAPAGVHPNTTFLLETDEGGLVLPNEYAFYQPGVGGKRSKMGVCGAFTSADGGATWLDSHDNLWVHEDGGAVQGLCEAPVVAQTSQGRLLMFMRSEYPRIAESASDDGGRTWSHARLNDLISSRAEIFLTRVPSTGDLLCVWNQASNEEIETGFYRARLTAAISTDGGATWGNFRTVAMSPGQPLVGRIEDPDPPALLVTPWPVPPEEHMVSDEFHMNRAPRVQFIGDKAYIGYTHRAYRYVDGERVREHVGVRLKVMPVGWFYEPETRGSQR